MAQLFKLSIKAVRANADMTLTEWARELGVAVSTVSGWENGTGEPNWTQVRKMSELSGIPLDYIFVPEKSE